MRMITKLLSILLIIILCILQFCYNGCEIDPYVWLCGIMLAMIGFIFSIKKHNNSNKEDIGE